MLHDGIYTFSIYKSHVIVVSESKNRTSAVRPAYTCSEYVKMIKTTTHCATVPSPNSSKHKSSRKYRILKSKKSEKKIRSIISNEYRQIYGSHLEVKAFTSRSQGWNIRSFNYQQLNIYVYQESFYGYNHFDKLLR